MPGVGAVNVRSTTTLSIFLRDGKTKVQGTVIGVPATGSAINALSVTAGHAFAPTTGASVAVVEQHTADDLDVAPGDSLAALGIGGQSTLSVTGVALSPEYLLPAQSQQQIVTTPGSFAVIFVPEAVAEQLGGGAAVAQALVRYAPGADADALDARLTTLANRHGAALVEPLADQPSNAVIAGEQTGFDEASLVIPGLLLVVAVFVGALACARVDDARRRRRSLAVASAAGGVAGVVLGLVAGRIAGPKLADAVFLPTAVLGANVVPALVGLALAAVAALLALGLSSVLRVGRSDTFGVGPAIVTAVAAAAAIVCVVPPAGVVDSADATLDAAAHLERADAQVAFATPVTAAELATLRAIPGVAAAEAVPSANIFVAHGDHRYATELEAFDADTTMQSFETPDGKPLPLPAQGALIPQSLAAILQAQPGDELEVTLPGAGIAPFRVPVAALTSDTLGNLVFLRISALRDALGADANAFAGGLFDTATIRFAPGADPARIARDVQADPAVVVYVPVAADLNSVAVARPIFAVITDVLLAIGALVTVLGVTSAVVLHVHTKRSLGTGRLVLEVLAALAVGLIVGAALGTAGADRLVHALDSELIHIVRHIDASTYAFAAGLVLLVGGLTLAIGIATAPPTLPDGEGAPPVAATAAE